MDYDENIKKILNKIKKKSMEKAEDKITSSSEHNNHINSIYADINEIISALDKKFSELESVDSEKKRKKA